MSELRERCEEIADQIDRLLPLDVVLPASAVPILEAFAKEQQIKGMEAASRIAGDFWIGRDIDWWMTVTKKEAHTQGCLDIKEAIDAEIKQRKEGW